MQKQQFPVGGGGGERVKSLSTAGGVEKFQDCRRVANLGGVTFAGGSVPHYMQCNFHLSNDPFHCAKFKKNSYSGSRVMTMCHFWTQYGPFAPINFFLENYYHSHLPISSFHCAKSKKTSSSGSRVMRMSNFWAQNDPFLQMRIFSEKLLMSLVSFIHAYLHIKN